MSGPRSNNTSNLQKRTTRMVIALVGMALCFYFGFIIAQGLSG